MIRDRKAGRPGARWEKITFTLKFLVLKRLKLKLNNFFLDIHNLADHRAVESFRDQCQMALNRHISVEFPSNHGRFGRILLLFGRLQRSEQSLIEDVFFRKEIGDIAMGNLVRNIFHRS